MYSLLNVKSNYSLLSSLLKIDDIINFSLKHNYSSCVLCDNSMYKSLEFYKKCLKNNLKPVIGLEITLENLNKINLYAENYNGYKNLIKLSTIQSERKINYNDLSILKNDLICIVPFNSIDEFSILEPVYSNIYLGYSNKTEENRVLIISKDVVFFKEALYLEKKQSSILDFLYRIKNSKTISDDVEYDIYNKELNISDITSLSSNEGILNVGKIIDKCNLEFPKSELLLPIYKLENNVTADEYLYYLSKKGLEKRFNNDVDKKYYNRLLYELKIIKQMGFANYFLVVYDFILYSKKHDILVGPGRGSAAGSLVSFSLGITDIDPIKYDLLFERFLNPERVTMPDIDTDFPDNKRDEVIKYVIEKYGPKAVAGIITFGTLGAKQVIRDVGRVMNIPIYKIDKLTKYIPTFSKDSIKDIISKNEFFKASIESDSQLKKMYDIALYLEGFPRHTSSHAAGIVMCSKDLDEVVPLEYNNGFYLTAYSMEYLEELGLLKMDFLGLKNLSLIDNILKDIEKNYNKKIIFSEIPLDDKQTLEIFKNADTTGIFQFESTGMRNFLSRLKPDSFEDIFAAIALFRPGPAVNIDSYIRRKQGLEKVTYLDNSLEPILKNTYGILIYQEQIMQVANVFAGYTLGEADILRRAMSKKKFDLLKSEEEKFISKSIKLGRSEVISKKLFELILNFAGYGFNRSHSVAYSIIAYKMAYLKVRYKHEFYSNLLSNVIGSDIKTSEYIMEIKEKDIEILKPEINISDKVYVVDNGKIYYPFSNIKSVGVVSSVSILKARETGKFIDVYDAISRLVIEKVGEKTIETLIFADCFRSFGYNKKTLIDNLDSLLNYAKITIDIDPSLVIKPDIIISNEYDDDYLLEKEKEVFGFYLSQHPSFKYRKQYNDCIYLKDIRNHFNKQTSFIVLIDKIKVIDTKKGEKMAFIDASDESGRIDFTFFPAIWKNYSNLTTGNIVKIEGTVEKRLDKFQVIVKKVTSLN